MKAELFLFATVLLALASCKRSPSIEHRLIGTWSSPMIISVRVGEVPKSAADTVYEITYTADHRELWRVRGGAQLAAGHWRVEGDELVTTMETESFFGGPGITRREKISKITPEEVVFTDGSNEGRWKRVR